MFQFNRDQLNLEELFNSFNQYNNKMFNSKYNKDNKIYNQSNLKYLRFHKYLNYNKIYQINKFHYHNNLRKKEKKKK